MDRYLEVAYSATPPSAPAASVGYPTNGNPQTATPASEPGEWWFHMMTEEMRNVVIAAGLTPSHSNTGQLAQAIAKLVQVGQRAVILDSATFNAGVANGNAVYWDSANNRFDKALADGTAKQNMVGIADVTNSKVYAFGDATNLAGLTAGSRYYLDGTTAGAITTTAPANLVFVGIAKSTTELYVDVDYAPATSAAASVQGSFKNLQLSASGTGANVTVFADEIALEDGSNSYVTARTVSLTINSAGSGANGLDTGSLAASTWYSVWVIRKPDGTTAGLLSTSATAPTMPSGYTYKARVGWIRTDGTANKYPLSFKQYGRRVQYALAAGSNVTSYPTIASGTAASLTAASTSAVAPSTAASVRGFMNTSVLGANVQVGANAVGSQISYTNGNVSGYAYGNMYFDVLLESANIYWASASGGATIAIEGWEDNL